MAIIGRGRGAGFVAAWLQARSGREMATVAPRLLYVPPCSMKSWKDRLCHAPRSTVHGDNPSADLSGAGHSEPGRAGALESAALLSVELKFRARPVRAADGAAAGSGGGRAKDARTTHGSLLVKGAVALRHCAAPRGTTARLAPPLHVEPTQLPSAHSMRRAAIWQPKADAPMIVCGSSQARHQAIGTQGGINTRSTPRSQAISKIGRYMSVKVMVRLIFIVSFCPSLPFNWSRFASSSQIQLFARAIRLHAECTSLGLAQLKIDRRK